MESKIKSSIAFQKNKLKEKYSIQRAGFEYVIDSKIIDEEMDNLEGELVDMFNQIYQPKDKPWKRTRNILFKTQFINNIYDEPPIQILYTLACKWKIMIIINETRWLNFEKEQIMERVMKISSGIGLDDVTTVDIYENDSIKWIEIYIEDCPLYEFYVPLFAKLILLLADNTIFV